MISTTMQQDFARLAAEEETYRTLQGQRIYITGATGQIGWYLVHFICYLVQAGHLHCQLAAHVRGVERLAEKYPDHATLPCRFEVTDDAARPLVERDCDLVIHCASKASPKHFDATPVDVMEPNAIVTHAILEKLRLRNRASRFVFLSSTGVTGFIPDEQRPSTESDFGPLSCTDLANCYLESKRFGEMLSLAYFRQYGIPVLIVRPSITYGPGFDLDDGRSYADFIHALVQKKPIRLTSDGSAIRNFLYISDFVKGLLLAIGKAPPGAVFNIASPSPISILDLATQLNDAAFTEKLGPVEHVTAQRQALIRVNFKSTNASVEKMHALGWSAAVSPLEGFKRTLRHYEECKDENG